MEQVTALPNGVLVTPSRDVMDRVTTLPVTSTPPASYGYTYGPVGNRLTADTTSFNYDSVYGLTKETKPSGALSYLLDAVGNRQSLTSTLAALSPQSFSYDPNDRIALGILGELFKDRPVVGIHAVDLVLGSGSLHCLTQQQPV